MALVFQQLIESESSSYTYVLGDSNTREALLIDAVLETAQRDEALLRELGLKPRFALETHCHADHVTAAGWFADRHGTQIVASKQAGVAGARNLADGDLLRLGDHALQAIATPGHTDGCMSYHGAGRVFTGDALLIGGCGRTDFQQGDAGRLFDSVTQRLFTLPEATLVFPAHDYKGRRNSSIAAEKQGNPRLANKSRAAFIALMAALGLPKPKQIERAVPGNQRAGRGVTPRQEPVRVPPDLFNAIPGLFAVWVDGPKHPAMPPVPNLCHRSLDEVAGHPDLPRSRTIGLMGTRESDCLAMEAALTEAGYDVVVLQGGWYGAKAA